MNLIEPYRNCVLCPRQCRANRIANDADAWPGICGQTDHLRVAYVGPHFGEEPPITGSNGSGTIFFTGCSLKCSYCQNHQISHDGLGREVSLKGLVKKVAEMVEHDQVHNINFVTPDHFLPHVFHLVSLLRRGGIDLPVVYNLSGYQSVEALASAEDYVDIYLPDFKYSDPSLAATLSKCRDYPAVALEAISVMVRQKGFLDAVSSPGTLPAKKGVLVRHLVLPGKVANSINALTSLFIEFGPGLPLSLMSQYHPVLHQKDEDLNRPLHEEEFDQVYSHAMELGFEHLFVQFPEKGTHQPLPTSQFLPDFESPDPFHKDGKGAEVNPESLL